MSFSIAALGVGTGEKLHSTVDIAEAREEVAVVAAIFIK
jgi:hypothetical protein